MLSRSFMPESSRKSLLAYTPMFHARLFANTPKYRETCFQPLKSSIPDPPLEFKQSHPAEGDVHLDGNPSVDRPLFVQFCANDPDQLLTAAKLLQPYCDAVDLNLGCPQGIAKKGNYGAFLQEDWGLIHTLISNLHENLNIPVTAKMRILETPEKTLEYAKTILSAGASILTVHGRQRHQKGHNTGLADWTVIRYLREHLPADTVLFANGNILQHEDIQTCLEATGADGIMSAEGNLHDPAVFAPPPVVGEERREYWRGRDGKGGWRMDAVLRRYMDIIYEHVLQKPPPVRQPLFIASDSTEGEFTNGRGSPEVEAEGPPKKKQKKNEKQQTRDPNLTAMQAHLFQMLRPLVTKHTNIRDALARSRGGDIAAFENVLSLVEKVTREGILEYEMAQPSANGGSKDEGEGEIPANPDEKRSTKAAIERCKRLWWVCQPHIRPSPVEALANGALALSKKDKKKLEEETHAVKESEGKVRVVKDSVGKDEVEVPKDGLVCG